jgi:hypothetical protein
MIVWKKQFNEGKEYTEFLTYLFLSLDGKFHECSLLFLMYVLYTFLQIYSTIKSFLNVKKKTKTKAITTEIAATIEVFSVSPGDRILFFWTWHRLAKLEFPDQGRGMSVALKSDG